MKKAVAVLFGGQSSEHEVSCNSAMTIVSNIDKHLYDVVLIGITKEGKWIHVESIEDIKSDSWRQGNEKAVISPDAVDKGVYFIKGDKISIKKIDVVFPVLHGLYGEDGTIQGILELAKIPYVGCGVLASSLAMDKIYTKVIVDNLGIKQAKYAILLKSELKNMDASVKKVEETLGYPVFIKPSNAGSSRGVSKANNKDELINGLNEAAKHDRKILVEETIVGRELECAVLGGEDCRASGVGEIIAGSEFYDYDAKYNNDKSKTVVSPKLPEGIESEIKKASVDIFRALDCYGLSRVDFFLTKDTNQVVFNEINTLPGFTEISMYPMLWESKGIGKPQLIDKLIQSAFARSID